MAQVPVAHVAVAFVREHDVPQAAQFVSEVSATSQPFAGSASQLPKPTLHEETPHAPVAHVAVALARAQMLPHVAQLVSVVSAVSQPFAALTSQLP